MKFFITGATGFIGQHLCKHLVAQGHSIVALVRNLQKTNVLPQDNVELIQGDLSSFKDKNFLIPCCDQVIHLAGTVTAKKQAEYFKYNFEAVQDLYACLLRQNWKPKRLHFASSLAATGPSPKDGILTETDQPKPVDDYGRAKLAAENFLLSQNQFPITIFRPCAVIGPMDTNIFNLYKIGKSGFGFVPWGNNQKVSFISVSDLVEAIFQLTNDLSQNHQTYFISHDDSTDTRSLWKEVGKSINKNIKLIPVPKPILYLAMKTNTVYANLFAKPNVFDKKYYDQLNAEGWVCSNNKLKSDHFWEAKQSLSEVVAETAQSYRQAGWL